jgi:hypothetical protein
LTLVVPDSTDRTSDTGARHPAGGTVDLYWIPLGAGAHVVRVSGWLFEAACALVQRRPRRKLFHSALVVDVPEGHFVIEMTPVVDDRGDERGVVGEGAVGSRFLGRLRVFRYEIRRWRGGAIPDVDDAVGSPVRVVDDPSRARTILELLPSIPMPVWGRDELDTGEMWNSNSVVAWALARGEVDLADVGPPSGGRAPGWSSGLVVAHREVEGAARAAAVTFAAGDPSSG